MNDRIHDGSLSGQDMVDSWEDRCLDWNDVSKVVNDVSADNRSEYVNANKVELIDVDGRLKLGIDGNEYNFSRGSLGQLGGYLNGLGFRLLEQGQDDKERELINQLYVYRWHSFTREQPNKQLFLRLRDGAYENCSGSVRAILSGSYKPLDHSWIVDHLANERSNALIRFDEGAFRSGSGDVLKFDMIDRGSMKRLVESGGGFGGDREGGVDDVLGNMIAVSNNEVGQGRFTVLPSVYRCICANGAIMQVEKGENAISMVHKGRLDKDKILEQVVLQLGMIDQSFNVGMEQMNILHDGERMMLDGVAEEQLLMLVGKHLKNTKKEQRELLGCFQAEKQIMRMGAWGVFNGLTRWGSECDDLGDQQIIELEAGKWCARWQNEDNWRLDNKNAAKVNVGKECLFLGS